MKDASRFSFSRQAGEQRTASLMSASTLASSLSSALRSRAIAALEPARRHSRLALAFGSDHLNDLPPACDKVAQ